MDGTPVGRGGAGRSWGTVLLVLLAAGAGVGTGILLAPIWMAGPEVESVGANDTEAAEAFEGRWATVLRDGPGAGVACPSATGRSEGTLQMGATPDGHPWMGSPDPVVEIQAFTDYRCPDCRRACRKVRRLLSLFPDRVRVVYRNFPMDPSCNPAATSPIHDRACELARIAACAGRQGRFWEAHDFLLQNADAVCAARRCAMAVARTLDLDEDAFQCCMRDGGVDELVARDVAEARELGVRVTPTFVIGGRLFEKAIPDDALVPLKAGAP